MRPHHYLLNEDHSVTPTDLYTWAEQVSKTDRTVAKSTVRGMLVSTVFLGLDHNFSEEGPPHIFETMVFKNGYHDILCIRTATWDEALKAHVKGKNFALFNELYLAWGWLLRYYWQARTALTQAIRRLYG